MSTNRTLKTIRTDVESRIENKIKTKTSLLEGLPVLAEAQRALAAAKRMYDATRESVAELCDMMAEFVLKNPTYLDEKEFTTSSKGVQSGDITIGDVVYHLSAGYGEPKRIDGEQLNQDFLSALPKDWAKAIWKIDTTSINRLGVSIEQLKEQGLYRPAKYVWSESERV